MVSLPSCINTYCVPLFSPKYNTNGPNRDTMLLMIPRVKCLTGSTIQWSCPTYSNISQTVTLGGDNLFALAELRMIVSPWFV